MFGKVIRGNSGILPRKLLALGKVVPKVRLLP